jgi:hypothetical protein
MDLLKQVQDGLSARKGEWKKIAVEVPEVSYSWISQVGRGNYTSEPSYKRLKAVADYLRRDRKTRKAA